MKTGLGQIPDVGGEGKPKYRRWDRTKPCDRDPRGRWYVGKPTVKERLMANTKIDETTGCWIWNGPRNENGYGVLGIKKRKNYLTHRVSYELEKGPIPEGMFICHRCDNPPCINPDHLFCGTAADNSADMIAKGRKVQVRGVENGQSKLSEEDVYEIRSATGTLREIGARYGISHPQVLKIRRRIDWGHLPEVQS